jgi:hypothetical protein
LKKIHKRRRLALPPDTRRAQASITQPPRASSSSAVGLAARRREALRNVNGVSPCSTGGIIIFPALLYQVATATLSPATLPPLHRSFAAGGYQ